MGGHAPIRPDRWPVAPAPLSRLPNGCIILEPDGGVEVDGGSAGGSDDDSDDAWISADEDHVRYLDEMQ